MESCSVVAIGCVINFGQFWNFHRKADSRFSESTNGNRYSGHIYQAPGTSPEMYRTSSSNVGAGVRRLSHSQRGESPAPDAASGPVRRMALADFENLVTIAKGSFGTVYKAVRKDTGRVYALKQVEIANMNRAEREEAVDEVRLQIVVGHRRGHPTETSPIDSQTTTVPTSKTFT